MHSITLRRFEAAVSFLGHSELTLVDFAVWRRIPETRLAVMRAWLLPRPIFVCLFFLAWHLARAGEKRSFSAIWNLDVSFVEGPLLGNQHEATSPVQGCSQKQEVEAETTGNPVSFFFFWGGGKGLRS